MNEQQEQQVLQHLLEATDAEIELADITPDMSLRQDLGLDSLAAMELALRIEEELDVSLTNDEAAALETVQDILELIAFKQRNSAL